jgi:hypothetical protein
VKRASLLLCGLLAVAAAGADDAPAPAAASTAASATQDAVKPQSRKPGPAAVTRDNLDLDTTTITGNRELPRVMYVVPWKRAEPGDQGRRPASSLLDEVLAPVDRDVFRRQLGYFDAIDPDRPGSVPPGREAEPAQ